MMVLNIQGTTRRLGKNQGFKGLPVIDMMDDLGNPIMGSAWQPTPTELARMNAGAPLYLWLFGTEHPPVALEVGDVPNISGS